MSCEACDKAQDEGMGYYIRIGNANVKVSACEKHFSQLQGLVRAGIGVARINASQGDEELCKKLARPPVMVVSMSDDELKKLHDAAEPEEWIYDNIETNEE